MFSGQSAEASGILTFSGNIEFFFRDGFANRLAIGQAARRPGFDEVPDLEIIDPIQTIVENIQRPIEDYLPGLTKLPPSGPQRLVIRTGAPMQ